MKIIQFIKKLFRPYHQMARDTEREAEALEWSDALIGDADVELRQSLDRGFEDAEAQRGRFA